jgi:hypothetical protein
MTRFVDIVKKFVTPDMYGFAQETEEVMAAGVRAYVEPRRASKRWADLAAFSDASILFRFRFIPGLTVTHDMFVLFDGKRYRLLSVEDVRGRHMYIEALAEIWEPSMM